MACGHAKYHGEFGSAWLRSGAGGDPPAQRACMTPSSIISRWWPIVGQTFVRAIGGDFQQEVKLLQLYSDVASSFCQQVNEPSSIRHCIRSRAPHRAGERTVTCVIVPADVQDIGRGRRAAAQDAHRPLRGGLLAPALDPPAIQLQQAADILNAGEKVAMLVGQGALHATDEVIAVAEALGAGVAKALLGKAAVPDDVPSVPAASACWERSRAGT